MTLLTKFDFWYGSQDISKMQFGPFYKRVEKAVAQCSIQNCKALCNLVCSHGKIWIVSVCRNTQRIWKGYRCTVRLCRCPLVEWAEVSCFQFIRFIQFKNVLNHCFLSVEICTACYTIRKWKTTVHKREKWICQKTADTQTNLELRKMQGLKIVAHSTWTPSITAWSIKCLL